MMLVEEDKLHEVLAKLEVISGRYKKKTNDRKVFVCPLCKKLPNQERPELVLGGKPIAYKEDEPILGFTLSQSIQGGIAYEKRLKARTVIAATKLETIGSTSGSVVRPEQVEKYYKSLFLPVLTAHTALPQLDRPNGATPGYELARRATGEILRRMLSTSGTTSPVEMIAEAGWDLPDKEIIKNKLRLMERLLTREYECRERDAESKEYGERRDAPSLVLRQRIKDVEAGETTGFCAEVKRIWIEADMANNWPPLMGQDDDYRGYGNDIETAATTISQRRMEAAIKTRSRNNPDTPYDELWDGTTWRLTNGSRRQVGLMTSARMDALVLNDCGPMRKLNTPNECACCGSGYDNLQHLLLSCEHEQMKQFREALESSIEEILSEQQMDELQLMDDHDVKMLLLGKQPRHALNRGQQQRLDLAMKRFLQNTDDFRTKSLDLNPMCGRIYTRPPEESMQQAAQWDRLRREDMRRKSQENNDEDKNSE
jgi:hypothetical protein